MDSQNVFAKLCDVLAHLYPTYESAQRVVNDARLDVRRISSSAQPLENWRTILAEAVRMEKLDTVLGVSLAEYDNNDGLLAAYGIYRRFVEQEGRLIPPLDLPQENQGDNVSITAQIDDCAKNVNVGQNINQTNIESKVITGRDDLTDRDKSIHILGDEVRGDKIDGDKIVLGSATDSTIAIGHGAIASSVRNFFFGNTWETVSLLRIRKVLLQNVSKFWIDGVLKRSLYNEILLNLGLEDRPSAVDNRPWDMVLQTPQQPDHPLSPSTKVIDVFDLQQSLLILGTSGSGKTTMLLELARGLIVRAQQDVTCGIPVVFNLSSWATKRQPLEAWLVRELDEKYYISRTAAQELVKGDQMILLLDGLDEISLKYRDACVETINVFLREHNVSVVVCCRIADYEVLKKRLRLQGAVFLQSLTQEQIDSYFELMGGKYHSINQSIKKFPSLRELATTPLVLNILILAYHDVSFEELEILDSVESVQQHMFDNYIQRMFEHRSPEQHYSRQQTIRWLTWLANNMAYHKQTVFTIESIKPGWLLIFSRVLLYRLSVGGSVGLSVGLCSGFSVGQDFGINVGLGASLIVAMIDIAPYQVDQLEQEGPFALIGILIAGLLLWLFIGLMMELGLEITTGLSFGTPYIVGYGQIGIVLLGLLGVLITWLSVQSSKAKEHTSEQRYLNPGIRRAARVSLIFGSIGALIGGLIGGPMGGLMSGLITGLVFGGVPCIQHYALRLFLHLYDYAPVSYARFLDYAAERLFLRRVGDGYIFIHQQMMEHFASLTEEDIKRLSNSEPIG